MKTSGGQISLSAVFYTSSSSKTEACSQMQFLTSSIQVGQRLPTHFPSFGGFLSAPPRRRALAKLSVFSMQLMNVKKEGDSTLRKNCAIYTVPNGT